MANNPFTTYTTTPSLGATDLAHSLGTVFVIGVGGLEVGTRPAARHPLRDLLRRLAALRPGARNAH